MLVKAEQKKWGRSNFFRHLSFKDTICAECFLLGAQFQKPYIACMPRAARSTSLKKKKTAATAASSPRDEVMEIVKSSQKPLGAYIILEKFKKKHPNAAPPTIYRALEYLQKNNLVHRIEKLNAYVACCHGHGCAAQFLVCSACGTATEIEMHAFDGQIGKVARQYGFKVEQSILELVGTCSACA